MEVLKPFCQDRLKVLLNHKETLNDEIKLIGVIPESLKSAYADLFKSLDRVALEEAKLMITE